MSYNKEYQRKYREKTSDNTRKTDRKYREENREKIREKHRRYREKHFEKTRERQQQYRKNNFEYLSLVATKFQNKCKEMIPNPKTGPWTHGEITLLTTSKLTLLETAVQLNRSYSAVIYKRRILLKKRTA